MLGQEQEQGLVQEPELVQSEAVTAVQVQARAPTEQDLDKESAQAQELSRAQVQVQVQALVLVLVLVLVLGWVSERVAAQLALPGRAATAMAMVGAMVVLPGERVQALRPGAARASSIPAEPRVPASARVPATEKVKVKALQPAQASLPAPGFACGPGLPNCRDWRLGLVFFRSPERQVSAVSALFQSA